MGVYAPRSALWRERPSGPAVSLIACWAGWPTQGHGAGDEGRGAALPALGLGLVAEAIAVQADQADGRVASDLVVAGGEREVVGVLELGRGERELTCPIGQAAEAAVASASSGR